MTRFTWTALAAAALVAGGVFVYQALAQCGGGSCGPTDKAPAGGHCAATAPADSGAASKPASQPAPPAAASFVNSKCPIMGNPIDPNKVPQNLTREYNGQKVAFCCGGCPAAWDRLKPVEKDAKLKAAGPSK